MCCHSGHHCHHNEGVSANDLRNPDAVIPRVLGAVSQLDAFCHSQWMLDGYRNPYASPHNRTSCVYPTLFALSERYLIGGSRLALALPTRRYCALQPSQPTPFRHRLSHQCPPLHVRSRSRLFHTTILWRGYGHKAPVQRHHPRWMMCHLLDNALQTSAVIGPASRGIKPSPFLRPRHREGSTLKSETRMDDSIGAAQTVDVLVIPMPLCRASCISYDR
jgi:hypothetical protein